MSGPAKNVESFILKDGDKDFTARISFPEGTRPPGFTQETLKRYVSIVTTGMDQIHSNLPNGSTLILAVMPSKSLPEEKTASKSARKKRKKKSQPTGKRKRPTSKGAAKKAKTTK
jgi:hypothetical protein